ncbi:hypothetical protein AX15_006080 [Amanita polypyramis BW_CC]|nr:hypothetical protein AX15_006080 [Amanita polypyramis BW_CC]
MHVLRSTYLPAYLSLVRSPHTSDPFPVVNDFSPGAAPLYTPGSSRSLANISTDPFHSFQRESAILDLFIALKAHEDVWADESELHLERHEAFKDLFDLHQPRSRLEDLVRTYGVQGGVITVRNAQSRTSSMYSTPSASTTTLASSSKSQHSPQPSQSPRSVSRPFFSFWKAPPRVSTPAVVRPPPTAWSIMPIPFHLLSVSFTPRKVGLVLTERQRKRTIVEVQRDKEELLENTSRQLVSELKYWLQHDGRI